MFSRKYAWALRLLPKEYVRAMRLLPTYRWWRPLLALVLAYALYLLFRALFAIPFALYAVHTLRTDPENAFDFRELLDGIQIGGYDMLITDNPVSILFVTVAIIVALPAVALALRAAGLGGLGSLSSVEGRLRWGRLGEFLVIALVSYLSVRFLLTAGLDIVFGYPVTIPTPHVVPAALAAILILVPLQSAAEEYVFRGFLMQVCGSWIPVVVIPVLIQALMFAAGHPYHALGVFMIAFMGFTLGLLTVMFGGIEAAIAFHVVNNLMSFSTTSLFGDALATYAEPFLFITVCCTYASIALRLAPVRGWYAPDSPYLDAWLALSSRRKKQPKGERPPAPPSCR